MSLVVNVVVLAVLTKFTNLGIYSVLASTIAYSLCMRILNDLAVRKYLDYRGEFVNTYIKPIGAAAGMGAVAWIVYYGLHLLIPVSFICLLAAVIFAVVVYLIDVYKRQSSYWSDLHWHRSGYAIISFWKNFMYHRKLKF